MIIEICEIIDFISGGKINKPPYFIYNKIVSLCVRSIIAKDENLR